MADYRVSTDNLNLREGPGMDFAVVKQLALNTQVEKLEVSETGFWFKVKTTQNGANLEGWVSGELLEAVTKVEWVDRIGEFNVERRPIPRPGNKPLLQIAHPMIGVLHTTEHNDIEVSFDTLKDSHSAPHFIAGENKIIQCRPLTAQGAALESTSNFFPNNFAAVQIEMVGFSKQTPWLPANSSLLPVLAILRWAAKSPIDIPLRRPTEAWLDDCSDCPLPWAVVGNRRRLTPNIWTQEKGWYMHMEVPHNDHWDCGALKWREILERASS